MTVPPGPRSRGPALLRLLGGCVVALACLDSGAASGPASGAAAPSAPPSSQIVLVDDRGRRVVLPGEARRIVSLLPSLTETVCAIRACDRLVGVDRSSNWPPGIASLPRLGGLEDTSIERIVALGPDLVLAPSSSRAIERLEALGLRVLALEPKDAAQTRGVLRTVGAALGRPEAGESLWRDIDARIAAASARVPASLRGARVYFEVSEAPHAAGAASFIGETLARLGLANIAPAELGPFPQLNPEFIVRAAPDIVMATDRSIGQMRRRPGWSGLGALRADRLCGFPSARYDVLVRAGPRLGEAAETLADCLVAIEDRASARPSTNAATNALTGAAANAETRTAAGASTRIDR